VESRGKGPGGTGIEKTREHVNISNFICHHAFDGLKQTSQSRRRSNPH